MNPYALMAAVAFWVLSLGAVGIWQYDDGAQHERLVWKTQQSNLLRTALADVSRLQRRRGLMSWPMLKHWQKYPPTIRSD